MLDRQTFGHRFRLACADPLFEAVAGAIERGGEVAWQAYAAGRKSPRTERAGEGFDDPDFELSSEWLATRRRLLQTQEKRGRRRRPPGIAFCLHKPDRHPGKERP